MSLDASMPHDLDAERAVIGAVLLDAKTIADAGPEVAADDFYHPAHKAIWESICELDKKSSPIDATTVSAVLRDTGRADVVTSVGGDKYIADLVMDAAVGPSVAFHSRAVAKKAERRRWIWLATEMRSAGLAGGSDDAFLEDVERKVMAATSRKRSRGPQGIKKVLGRVVKTLEYRYDHRFDRAVTGIPSGLEYLDALTQGWQNSDLVIVAGRPSMGKTSLAMCSAVEAARVGIPTLFFSLEMSAEALTERVIAMEGNVDSNTLRSGQIDQKTWIRLSDSFGKISDLPIWIEEESGLRVGEIRSRTRRWRMNDAKNAARVMVVVDYIGLVRPDVDNPRNREREVAQVSEGLKALAKDIKSPVMALSQLNRTCETRADKRPILSDLRESGSIEQDADVIAFLYRDEWYHDEPPSGQCKKCGPGVAEIIIAKQRNGATGCAHVGWRAQSTKFVNLTQRESP